MSKCLPGLYCVGEDEGYWQTLGSSQVYVVKLKVILGNGYGIFTAQFFQHFSVLEVFYNKIVGKETESSLGV